MPAPLLKTKLFVPRLRPGAVARPHLTARLTAGLLQKLILISAPAGFGKTTLMAEWRATPEGARPLLGWVALDEGDQDPMRFWLYALSALEGARPGATGEALPMLRANPPAPVETVLLALVNALADLPEDLILVLDDYHVIEAEAVHAGMRFLLDHLPQSLHLVLLTRVDPPLPLSRLRAKGELAEIRARDLRFSVAEAGALLTGLAGGDVISPAEVGALAERTEGWAAGLQLAGLSLQGRPDASGFISAFVSTHHYLVDYLVEEVLHRQPADVQRFLLETSVLDRLSGPLCEAVTGQSGGRAMLEMLEQRGLFTAALDAERRWFRYHHLFSDILRTHLQDLYPGRAAEVQRKACDWFRAQGLTVEAVHAALAAKDFDQAAELLEDAAESLWQESRAATLRSLINALPESVLAGRPRLLVHHLRLLLLVEAEVGRGEPVLATARAALAKSPLAGTPEGHYLEAQLDTLAAISARATGDADRAIAFGKQALAAFPADDTRWWPLVSTLLSLTYQAAGNPEDALAVLREGGQRSRAGSDLFMAVLQTCLLGDVELSLGRLRSAYDAYTDALRMATGQEGRALCIGWAHVGLGFVLYERGQVLEGLQHLEEGLEAGRRSGHVDTVWRASRLLAYISLMQGDLERARAAINQPETAPVLQQNPMSWSSNLAQQAHLQLLQGNLAGAASLCDQIGPHLDNALAASWPETLAPARVLLGRGRHDAARQFLERRLAVVEGAGEVDPQIRTLVLLALVLEAAGDGAGAVAALGRALALGEPEGYRRAFLDEGDALRGLMQAVRSRGVLPQYVDELLGTKARAVAAPGVAAAAQALAEPLTDRELEVLRLAATGMSNQEIGARIFVAAGTVKNHMHSVIGKLGVANRLQAINRARELGLL